MCLHNMYCYRPFLFVSLLLELPALPPKKNLLWRFNQSFSSRITTHVINVTILAQINKIKFSVDLRGREHIFFIFPSLYCNPSYQAQITHYQIQPQDFFLSDFL